MRLLIHYCTYNVYIVHDKCDIVTVNTSFAQNFTASCPSRLLRPAHSNEWEGLPSATLIAADLHKARG